MADDLRKLKDEAARLTEKGRHPKAAEIYARIAEREPEDPQWSQRAGEACKRAGAPREALRHFVTAAEGYARHGFLLKAIAMAKLVLAIDPKHTRTHEMVASLYSKEKTGSAVSPPLVPPPPRSPPRGGMAAGGAPISIAPPAAPAPMRPAEPTARLAEAATFHEEDSTPLPVLPILPGATVDTLPLSEVIAGAKPAEGLRKTYEIPLYDLEELEEVYEQEAAEPELELEVRIDPPPLPKIPLLSSLDQFHLRRLIEKVRIIEFADGDVVVREGERGEALYVVVRGEVEVTVSGHRGAVAHHREGAFFGELAVLTDGPRTATVTARGATQLMEMDRKVITSLIKDDPEVLRTLLRFCRDRLIHRFVSTSPLFQGFSADDAHKLAESFHFLEVEAGGQLLTEGERAPGLFLVLCGESEMMRAGRRVDTIGPGGMCGEVSLLTRGASQVTVRARSKVWCLCMKPPEFQELIVTYPQMLVYVSELADKRREQMNRVNLP